MSQYGHTSLQLPRSMECACPYHLCLCVAVLCAVQVKTVTDFTEVTQLFLGWLLLNITTEGNVPASGMPRAFPLDFFILGSIVCFWVILSGLKASSCVCPQDLPFGMLGTELGQPNAKQTSSPLCSCSAPEALSLVMSEKCEAISMS